MAARQAPGRAAPALARRESLRRLRARLLRALEGQRADAQAEGASAATDAGATGEGPDAVSHRARWLLGLELVWKTEELVLLPAIGDAAPHAAAAVGEAGDDIELMRSLVGLSARVTGEAREALDTLLHGLAQVHAARVDALLAIPSGSAARWEDMEREIRGLLARWREEVQRDGDIEDEERDPVGSPPR